MCPLHDAALPDLPYDVLARIWRIVWRQRDAAVCIQRAVRGVMARAMVRHGVPGLPWDMPGLVEEGAEGGCARLSGSFAITLVGCADGTYRLVCTHVHEARAERRGGGTSRLKEGCSESDRLLTVTVIMPELPRSTTYALG